MLHKEKFEKTFSNNAWWATNDIATIHQIQYNTRTLLPGSNATRYSMAYMTRIWHTLNFRVLIWVQLFGYLTCRSVQQHIIAAHLLDFITNANHEEQY